MFSTHEIITALGFAQSLHSAVALRVNNGSRRDIKISLRRNKKVNEIRNIFSWNYLRHKVYKKFQNLPSIQEIDVNFELLGSSKRSGR